MGEVYRARDTRLGRDVAIKILSPDIAASPDARLRFEREARTISQLSHPHICALYDIGESASPESPAPSPYLVMELLDGVTLRQRIDNGPLDVDTAVAIAIQIADALEAAHAKGIVHRDIKPGNVMIVGRGHVKVLDFGLAKRAPAAGTGHTLTLEPLTAAGSVVGTPQYLSPEVLRGAQADARGDVWAFGVMLYQMLSGRLPFDGATPFEMSSAILREAPPSLPASVPTALRAVVDRCLQKEPASRYQHASEIRAALEAARTGGAAPLHARPRSWWLFAGAAAAAVLIAGFLVWRGRGDSTGPVVSSGAPASAVQEANEAFELAINFQRVQNDIPRAQETFERALALDPHFSEARRYHAFDYVILLLNGYTNDVGLLYKAEEELRQVAQETPDLFTLPSAQTAVYLAQGRKELVPAAKLRQAGEKHPAHADTVIWRFLLHMFAGENALAKELTRDALTRQPLLGAMRALLGEMLRTEGDLAGAIREELKVLDQAPGNITAIQLLARAYIDNGDTSKARQLLEAKRPLFAGNHLWRHTWALLLAAEGQHDAAVLAMDEDTLKVASALFIWSLPTADFYALLGDTPKALEWLERAVRNGDERTAWFRRDPSLASIRNDPGFARIVDSIEARRRSR